MASQRYVDLKAVREEIGLTQSEFADMICVSARTVQSCEQGWRNPSPGVERSALLLLLAHRHGDALCRHQCWQTMGCSREERESCLAFRAKQGHLCWMLSGNHCQGRRLRSWEDKKGTCLACPFIRELLPEGVPTRPRAVD
jgi:DNA-binding XRE family transcriptional regulator